MKYQGYAATMNDQVSDDATCCCGALSDLAVVPMGMDGLDERVFASLERVIEHGGDQWWLYLSDCSNCSQNWMVAQDERVYDNYYLRRITSPMRQAIIDHGQWPDEFLTYEQVLRLGRTMSKPWTFLDPRSPGLVWTAEDLRRERPDISFDEIAYLLAIPVPDAIRLLQKPSMFDRFRAWMDRR
jgi:hypothetical protein